ncbi:hypothetical protein [Bradyrhizobium valentinum]|uniref:hypothetical protein n=1 Tax=Bradyrhizobium valentinum TaxID=1518501 RepID=UPI000A592B66|nr:hypothetical protein [Bradyrhizobium valentinum]
MLERDAIGSITEGLAGYLHENTLAQGPVRCIIFSSHRVFADGLIVANFVVWHVLGCHPQLAKRSRFFGFASGPFSLMIGIGAAPAKNAQKSARL